MMLSSKVSDTNGSDNFSDSLDFTKRWNEIEKIKPQKIICNNAYLENYRKFQIETLSWINGK